MAEHPFPPEVVERAEAAFDVESAEDRRALHRALSVIGDYLRSEEARDRGSEALAATSELKYGERIDAVIAALLGERGEG